MSLSEFRYSTQVVPARTTDGTIRYLATHPELPGCMADGITPEEAIANLEDALDLYLEDFKERGLPIPPPQRNPVSIVLRNLDAVPAGQAASLKNQPVPALITL